MNHMKHSIAPISFSTRLRSALISMRPDVGSFVLEDVLKLYAENPAQLIAEFLRIPGAGRATLNELTEYLDKHVYAKGTIGRIFTMHREDAKANISAIDRLLAHVDANSADYQRLRDVQEALKSSLVMIEQPDDTRDAFKVHGGS